MLVRLKMREMGKELKTRYHGLGTYPSRFNLMKFPGRNAI